MLKIRRLMNRGSQSFLVTAMLLVSLSTQASPSRREVLKQQILQLAESYQGQGDPDQSKQQSLEPLVRELVALNPMPPAKARLPLLVGAWKQVWGPYEFRKNDGSVDPKLGVREIYQVIFADGFYYNVAPYYPDQGSSREQIGLLRGEWELDPQTPNTLRVKFTDYPGVEPRPAGLELWELPELTEAGELENQITIVPSWVVRNFFGGGTLEEIYTDSELRLLYGQSQGAGARRSLFIMKRVGEDAEPTSPLEPR